MVVINGHTGLAVAIYALADIDAPQGITLATTPLFELVFVFLLIAE